MWKGLISCLLSLQNALFENTRKIPSSASFCSTEGSDTSSVNDMHHRVPQSRLPTEPWQVTKKHLNLSPQEIASLGGGEPGDRPEDMDSKVLKVSCICVSMFVLKYKKNVHCKCKQQRS